MAPIILILLLILPSTTTTTGQKPSPKFIQQQCQGTLYFQLCIKCLTTYIHTTNPTPAEIARIALRVSLVKARLARSYINQVANKLNTSKAEEYQAVKDCLAQITDGVDQISNSVAEFGRLSVARENEFSWHHSNVLTWLSTASTDALACMNGFPGHAMGKKTKNTIRAKVLNVAQFTSNALALVDKFVKRHRASRPRVINKP